MPICPNCGSEQPDGAAFCDDCGAALGEVAPAAVEPTETPLLSAPATVATTCPVCGASVTPGEAFCDNCGTALDLGVLVCSSCGTQLEPDSAFCDTCGAPVGAATPVLSVVAPAPSTAVYGRLVVQGTNATLPFPLGKTEIFVGREDPLSGVFPEIDLTDHGGDEAGVSRKHARIFVQGTQVLIEDLNSTNYTYVNQQRLVPGQPHPLNSRDEVQFGWLKLNFYSR